MKKVFILIMFSLLIVVSNVVAADLNGIWEGNMYCSHYPAGDSEYFKIEIIQNGDFFISTNIEPTSGEKCGGVLDGNKLSMTCESETIAYGEIKYKNIYIINHILSEAATCKGTATLIE